MAGLEAKLHELEEQLASPLSVHDLALLQELQQAVRDNQELDVAAAGQLQALSEQESLVLQQQAQVDSLKLQLQEQQALAQQQEQQALAQQQLQQQQLEEQQALAQQQQQQQQQLQPQQMYLQPHLQSPWPQGGQGGQATINVMPVGYPAPPPPPLEALAGLPAQQQLALPQQQPQQVQQQPQQHPQPQLQQALPQQPQQQQPQQQPQEQEQGHVQGFPPPPATVEEILAPEVDPLWRHWSPASLPRPVQQHAPRVLGRVQTAGVSHERIANGDLEEMPWGQIDSCMFTHGLIWCVLCFPNLLPLPCLMQGLPQIDVDISCAVALLPQSRLGNAFAMRHRPQDIACPTHGTGSSGTVPSPSGATPCACLIAGTSTTCGSVSQHLLGAGRIRFDICSLMHMHVVSITDFHDSGYSHRC